jgi:hypothetical protein
MLCQRKPTAMPKRKAIEKQQYKKILILAGVRI